MKTFFLFLIMSSTLSWAQSNRLQDKIQSEFGPEPTNLCQIGLLLKNGQVQMLPSRFLSESECVWLARSSLKKASISAKKALLTHGSFKKEIAFEDVNGF